MKESDCYINKPKVIRRQVDQSKSIEPPTKRKCVEKNVVTGSSSTVRVANARATQMNQSSTSITSSELNCSVRMDSSTKLTQVASKSNKAAQNTSQSSQKMAQITSQFNKNTEVTLISGSARSGHSKNALKISPEVSVKKVVAKVTKETTTSVTMKNSREKVIARRIDEMAKANGSKDKTGGRRIEEQPRQNNVPCRTDTLKVAMPKNQSGLDNTIDALRNRIASAKNQMVMKNVQRRKSMGAMVSIPTLRIGPQYTEPPKSIETANGQQRSKLKEPQELPTNNAQKTTAKPISMRRKTFVDKDVLSNKPRNEIAVTSRVKVPEPQPQLSVTLPVSGGIVTRSRRSAGNLARTVNLFSCDVCPYTSEVKTNWQRHMLIHTGLKPFQCQYCSKGFTQKVNLKSHMKSNHYDLHDDPEYWHDI